MEELPTIEIGGNGIATSTPHGAETLARLLKIYDDELRGAGAPIDEYLAPGVDEATVRSQFRDIGLVPPDELVVWFSWHDGLRDRIRSANDVLMITPLVVPASLESSVAFYAELSSWDEDGSYFWAPSWFPLQNDWRGLYVNCDVTPNQPPEIRRVDEVSHCVGSTDDLDAISLCTVVTGWIELIRSGAVEFRGRAWTQDLSKYTATQLAAKI